MIKILEVFVYKVVLFFYGFFNIRESSCGGVVSVLYPEDDWYREKPLAYTRVQ